MNKERESLLLFITEINFAIDDVVLYLDTHPCDKEALAFYDKYRDMRKQAVDEYTRCYGPLTNEDVISENCWAWVEHPWPWEGEC